MEDLNTEVRQIVAQQIDTELEQALEVKEALKEIHQKFDAMTSLPGYQKALNLSAENGGLKTVPEQNLDLTDIKVGVRHAYYAISEEVSTLRKMQY